MLNYRYAELFDTGKRWYVYYYVVNPSSGNLERKRVYLNRLKSLSNKQRYAKKLIDTINDRLDTGWNPFIAEKHVKQYTPIIKALEFVVEYRLAYIRERSKPTYINRKKVLVDWLVQKKLANKYIFEFTDQNANDFMNCLLIERGIRGVTYNNYLIDYRGFFNLLIKHKFVTENPFKSIDRLPETAKDKAPFTDHEQKIYKEYLIANDYDFFITSMYCYYCAIRPNEITQIKVSHVNLERKTIMIPAAISKNKKQRLIPIADNFSKHLQNYLKDIPDNYFLCGMGFKPSTKPIARTRISEHFREIADKIGLPKNVFFYSLKDTCADRLIEAGFSTKTLRDLFGHSDIATTDHYLRGINTIVDKRLLAEFPEF